MKKNNHDIIGFSVGGPCEYTRSSKPMIADCVVILKPGLYYKGLGKLTSEMLFEVYVGLGYHGFVTDAFACYPASYMFGPTHTFGATLRGHAIGRIPLAGRAGTSGWTDTLVVLVWATRISSSKY